MEEVQEMPLKFNWKSFFQGSGKKSLRSYYIIAGTYLVVVITVLAVLIIRWGAPPSLDLPGFEEGGREEGKLYPPAVEAPEHGEAEDASDPLQAIEHGPDQVEGTETEEEDAAIPVFPVQETDAYEEEELPELPAAATPVPGWELVTPFGSYHRTSLSDGGVVHHPVRGILLRTTPEAPVAALWDGKVAQVKIMDGLYRSSVLIEHADYSGNYSTFYGNLREVWVQEGTLISRGESIGLMAYKTGREQRMPAPGANGEEVPGYEETTRSVSGRPPAAEKALDIHTVWGGYLYPLPESTGDEAVVQNEKYDGAASLPAVLPVEEQQGLPEDAPLLYLEVRQGGTYLDPLNFITVRN